LKTNIENNSLPIYLEGRIDSTNAPAVETELFQAVNAKPKLKVQEELWNKSCFRSCVHYM